ncbi:hypothetical protein [Nocardioides sp. TF02-7]|uniref:hypothetical protein n=1 Tax=Nocardioides sp. TF02-7 TaxID=2917724 RepID=UPI001F06DE4B|nr:hypothetical protein [Nocardioides sp. TF02-7]UMG92361.1 hypothetical protein MF408_21135 [Nocardioides sp. TF02-7]
MVVVGGRHTFALDPDTGAWRHLEPSPGVGDFLIATDDGPVFVAYQQHPGRKPVDWLLDPDTGQWSALPRDPFGESYDRSMAWDGQRLWLLSMAVENHGAAYEGAPSRLAVLENGRWRVVEEETPPVTYEQDLWWHGERLVVAVGERLGSSRAYDPATGTWAALPSREDVTCQPPAAGPGPDWLSGGGGELVSAALDDTRPLPPCPALRRRSARPDLAVWAGETLFVWGSDFEDKSTTGLVWTPPPPG